MSHTADWIEAHQLACPVKSAVGIDCPGCGMQRSFVALLRGEIGESLSLYPALLPLLLTFALLIYFLIRPHRKGHLVLRTTYILAALLVVGNFVRKLLN